MKIHVGSYSTQGKRDRQEDAVVTTASERDPVAFLAVADGMGGHPRGDEASQKAVGAASDNWYEELLDGESGYRDLFVRERMVAAEEAVAKLAWNYAPLPREYRHGPGSTLTAVWVSGARFAFGHVGDSRLYYWKPDGTLHELTRRHGYKHLLSRALGNWDLGEAESDDWQLQPDGNRTHFDVGNDSVESGSALLLTTDGVHEVLTDEQIAKILRTAMSGGMAPDKICTHLVNAALQAGSDDNCTAAIAYFPPG